ncbi:hypothetical protein FORC10_p002 (plasmid) [Bacillus cereus]|nr:hypothetical protein FORC10_p002 [Bacillus cereus]
MKSPCLDFIRPKSTLLEYINTRNSDGPSFTRAAYHCLSQLKKLPFSRSVLCKKNL